MASHISIQTAADFIQSLSGAAGTANFNGEYPEGELTTSPRGYTWASSTDQGLIDLNQLGLTETMKMLRIQLFMAGQSSWTLSLLDGADTLTIASGTNETSYNNNNLGYITPGQQLKLVTTGASTTSIKMVVTLARVTNLWPCN